MRPSSDEEETSTPVPKPAKDKKRKNTSTSEDPKPKQNLVHKPKKDIVALLTDMIQRLREEEEEDEDDGSELVARVKKNIEAPKAAESVVVEGILPHAERVLEKDSGKVPKSSKIEDASRRGEQKASMFEGAGYEALRNEENAPSGSLRAIDIVDSLILSAFSEEAIREAQAMRTPKVYGGHGREDPFHDYFIGVEDAIDLNEASSLFNEAQQALNRVARAQLSLVESQLGCMKEKSSAQAKKIKELEARLASELAKAKSEAEKAKVQAEVIVAVYRADTEAAQVQAREAAETSQTRAHWIAELSKCQSWRETLEEIHARGFDLTDEIIKAKEHEADARALASSDDDDDYDGSKRGSENGEDLDGEEASPEEN
ncbi:uncharacterized protein [Nicotiana tomentosiformis]|uniref:uncharacterized protein n=1 Tax=Nicotiana tomentosiformis TaxID=4098 RepID=UPI00388C88EF